MDAQPRETSDSTPPLPNEEPPRRRLGRRATLIGSVIAVRVRPQVSGVLQQVLFKEGQMVRKGDLLATIDPRQFEMALQQAIGQRMRDEAQLQAARVTLERFRTLLQQDSIARQEVDTQA